MFPSKKRNILIALGSNTSENSTDSYSLVKTALSQLKAKSIVISSISKYYLTPAFPVGAGPDFINCVASATTEMSPDDVLKTLHAIEANLGRSRSVRWGQRSIDIDLLSYEDFIRPDEKVHSFWLSMSLERQMADAPTELILPHPRIQDRAFVLVPLADIAPDWVHPVLGKTTQEMCDALDENLIEEVRQYHPPS